MVAIQIMSRWISKVNFFRVAYSHGESSPQWSDFYSPVCVHSLIAPCYRYFETAGAVSRGTHAGGECGIAASFALYIEYE